MKIEIGDLLHHKKTNEWAVIVDTPINSDKSGTYYYSYYKVFWLIKVGFRHDVICFNNMELQDIATHSYYTDWEIISGKP